MTDQADREMTLSEYIGKLPELHGAHKEYRSLVAAASDGTAGLVESNISTIRDIHERTLRMISAACSQSLGAHPHHPDSYPEIMGIVEEHKRKHSLA